MNYKQLLLDICIEPQNKAELFLNLCALNYANVLVKDENRPVELQYHVVKGCVAMLVQRLTEALDVELSEEVIYNNAKDCVYMRCYGVQFSFHQVDLECLTPETRDEITNDEVAWDGIRLQPKAKELYILAQEISTKKENDDEIIISKIANILEE